MLIKLLQLNKIITSLFVLFNELLSQQVCNFYFNNLSLRFLLLIIISVQKYTSQVSPSFPSQSINGNFFPLPVSFENSFNTFHNRECNFPLTY